MPDGDLRHPAEVEEISIGFTRPSGDLSRGQEPDRLLAVKARRLRTTRH
jgi:hypothetical protein